MLIKKQLHNSKIYFNLKVLANQIVEGFVTGIHKSPFHGFSSEFSEHKVYNNGESTKHIDWKLFARTDKLYTKKYEDETNLRCHLIIDNSASMHYPKVNKFEVTKLNKIGFSVLASSALMQFLKKQRDAVGLSIYSNKYDFYVTEKGSERHHNLLLHQLENTLISTPKASDTNTVKYLHEIAENIHRRSLVVLFTDLFQYNANKEELFSALQHLKHNKHEVLLFHTLHSETEINFEFDDSVPKSFVDVETNQKIDLHTDAVQEAYQENVKNYVQEIKIACANYNIKYVLVNVSESFDIVLNSYLAERQRFK